MKMGLRWLDKWNEKGLEGIKYKWGDGRPSKLTENQKKELNEDMLNLDLKTTKQIKEHIHNKWRIMQFHGYLMF